MISMATLQLMITGLGVLITIATVYLKLSQQKMVASLRNEFHLMQNTLLEKIDTKYASADVLQAKLEGMELRITKLEDKIEEIH